MIGALAATITGAVGGAARSAAILPAALCMAVCLLASAGSAWAQTRPNDRPLSSDLARQRVQISAGFTGATLVLFGVVERPGDIVVVVRSALATPQTVLRKEHVLGFWIDRDRYTFDKVWAFYGIATNRPLGDIVPKAVQAELAVKAPNKEPTPIGLAYLNFGDNDAGERAAQFHPGLIEAKVRAGLYSEAIGKVVFLPGNLFKAELHLPSRIPPGSYTVSVYYFRAGALVDVNQQTLFINKIGIGATISDAAREHGLAYGLFALVAAAMAGLLSGYLFRQR